MITSTNAARTVAAGLLALTTIGGLAAAAPTASAANPATTANPATATASVPRATVHDIRFGVRAVGDHSAGASYVDLTYRNVTDHPVRIKGYAGVSLVAYGNGTQVGRPAIWLTNRRAVTVVLKPGQTTTEIVSIADAQNFGSTKGHTVRADGFRVYLPGSRAAAFVPYRVLASTRNVAQLQVDPIGARI